MMVHLRGGSNPNLGARLQSPGMYIKSAAPIRFAIPARMSDRPKGSLQASQSSHVFYKAGLSPQSAALKRPYHGHLMTSPSVIKFASPSQKTAIKFQTAPPVPLRSKPEYIYEKVNVPKYPEPVRYNIGSDGAIHTIQAPNLGSKDSSLIQEASHPNSLNSQFDSDLAKFSANGFSLTKPVSCFFHFHCLHLISLTSF